MKKKIKRKGLPRVASLLRVLALMGVVMTAATSYAQGQDPCNIEINGGSVTAISATGNAVGGDELTVSTKSYMTVTAKDHEGNLEIFNPSEGQSLTEWLDGKSNVNFEYTNYPVTVTINEPTYGTVKIGSTEIISGESYPYPYGTKLVLSAESKNPESYVFVGWKEGDEYITDPVLNHTVAEEGNTFTAEFSNQGCVTVVATEGGEIKVDDGIFKTQEEKCVAVNQKVTVTAKAFSESGYAFTGWFINGERVNTSLSFEYPVTAANTTLEARFTDQVIWVRVKKGNTGN